MRIYTTQPIKHHRILADGSPSRSYHVYHAAAFFEVPDELGSQFIAAGMAKAATDANVVVDEQAEQPVVKNTRRRQPKSAEEPKE